jgi:lysophospholipase L1-like esterase
MTRPSPLIQKTLLGTIAPLLLILGAGLCWQGCLSAVFARVPGWASPTPQNWEPTIRRFEESDKTNPPKPGVIVFTGSSSIVRWSTLVHDMRPLDVINRGFGGSEFSDLNQYTKRIVVAYHPKAVVVYEGDNDLAPGSPKTPEAVANDFRQFVQIVHSELPETWIYVISIKPSKLRWDEWPKMQKADQMMQAFSRTQERVQFIDVASAMFDAKGNLPANLFVADGLHPTPKAYALWTSVIKPILLERFRYSTRVSQSTGTAP